MKKALIITCNDSYDYETRTKYIELILQENGYQVEHLLSDFDHRNKKRYESAHKGNIHYVHVPSYQRNLSIRRIWSHICFGNCVRKFVMENEFDLIYHCAPPNYTIKILSKCKEKKHFKLITEIGDMWPESIPIGKGLKKALYIPFVVWSNLRDKHLDNSDAVIAECDLFRDIVRNKTGIRHIQTLYFCKEFTGNERKLTYTQGDQINLCYLGSINNIIDIPMIGKIVNALSFRTKVKLFIIGDGENRQKLIDIAKNNGAEVAYYGIVYDETVKKDVFSKCHYALNIMKPDVFVGMTMKSLDYFSAGMPIINNIGGDVWKMVGEENVGINVSESDCFEKMNFLIQLNPVAYMQMTDSVKKAHIKYFSPKCVNKTISKLI